MTGPTPRHVLVLNRWYDERAGYPELLDHAAHRVSYVTSPRSEAALRLGLGGHPALVEVADVDDGDGVLRAAERIARSTGPPAAVVALAERDLLTAAHLRARFGLRGPLPAAVAPLRDKVLMKRALAAAGVPVPAFAPGDDAAAVRDLVHHVGFPLVVKPRADAGSVGVSVVASMAELRQRLGAVDPAALECEEYLEGRMFHADGLVAGGAIRFLAVFEYVNTPLRYFAHREITGAVLSDDPSMVARTRALVSGAARALGLEDDAFHLELFRLPSGELRFLEIGARVGGGPIRRVVRDLLGVDLVRQHVRLQMGEELEAVTPAGTPGRVGGYLMVPEPPMPSRVTGARSLAGQLPTLVHEELPPVGRVLDGTAHYLNLCGLFVYRGATTKAVRRDMRATIERFSVEHEPVPEPDRARAGAAAG